jgi:hypothetical protein
MEFVGTEPGAVYRPVVEAIDPKVPVVVHEAAAVAVAAVNAEHTCHVTEVHLATVRLRAAHPAVVVPVTTAVKGKVSFEPSVTVPGLTVTPIPEAMVTVAFAVAAEFAAAVAVTVTLLGLGIRAGAV